MKNQPNNNYVLREMKDLRTKIQTNKKQLILFGLVLVFIFIAMFILNRMFPVNLDDWIYAFVYGTDQTRRVVTFSDLIESQYVHYMVWGGRNVVHFIAQFLLSLDTIWHDLINTFAFIIFVLVLYKTANIGKKINVALFVIVVLLVWLRETTFAGTMLWITGSANYLWGTLIIVSFLYSFYSYYITEKLQDGIPKSVLFFFFGVLAGWTNENMGAALVFLLIGLLVVFKYQKVKIPMWAIFGLVGAIVGFIIMVKAPGNYIRYELEMTNMGKTMDDAYTIEMFTQRFPEAWNTYRKHVLFLVILNIGFLILYMLTNKSEKKKKIAPIVILNLLAVHLAGFAMFAAPGFPPRAAFGMVALLIISLCMMYANLDFNKGILGKIYQGVTIALVVGLFIYSIFDYAKKFRVIHRIYEITHYRETYIDEHKKTGQMDYTFYGRLDGLHERYYYMDLSEDPEHWFNKTYSKYKGIRSVKVLEAPDKKE